MLKYAIVRALSIRDFTYRIKWTNYNLINGLTDIYLKYI
jgi:hypothetical protein